MCPAKCVHSCTLLGLCLRSLARSVGQRNEVQVSYSTFMNARPQDPISCHSTVFHVFAWTLLVSKVAPRALHMTNVSNAATFGAMHLCCGYLLIFRTCNFRYQHLTHRFGCMLLWFSSCAGSLALRIMSLFLDTAHDRKRTTYDHTTAIGVPT